MKESDYIGEKTVRVSITAAQIVWRGRKRRNGRRERERGRRDVCTLSTYRFNFICSQTALC